MKLIMSGIFIYASKFQGLVSPLTKVAQIYKRRNEFVCFPDCSLVQNSIAVFASISLLNTN